MIKRITLILLVVLLVTGCYSNKENPDNQINNEERIINFVNSMVRQNFDFFGFTDPDSQYHLIMEKSDDFPYYYNITKDDQLVANARIEYYGEGVELGNGWYIQYKDGSLGCLVFNDNFHEIEDIEFYNDITSSILYADAKRVNIEKVTITDLAKNGFNRDKEALESYVKSELCLKEKDVVRFGEPIIERYICQYDGIDTINLVGRNDCIMCPVYVNDNIVGILDYRKSNEEDSSWSFDTSALLECFKSNEIKMLVNDTAIVDEGIIQVYGDHTPYIIVKAFELLK